MRTIASILFCSFLLICSAVSPLRADAAPRVAALAKELKATYAQAYRDRAKKKLLDLGPQAVPELGRILKENDDSDVSLAILEILEEIRDARAVPAVIAFIDQTDSTDLVCQAVKTLGRLRSADALPRLLLLLKDAPETYFFEQDVYKITATTLWSLGEIGDPAAVDAILDFARSNPKTYYLPACAQALGKIGDERALAALLDWLRYQDREVRLAAAEALPRFVTPQMSKFLWMVFANETDVEVKSAVVDLIAAAAREPDMKKLVAMLRSGQDFEAQRMAERALKKLAEKAVPVLVAALGGDADPEQKINGLRVLADLCSTDALAQIQEMTADKNAMIRLTAIESLGKCGDPSSLDLLTKLTYSFDKSTRRAAASAKEKIQLRLQQIVPPRAP